MLAGLGERCQWSFGYEILDSEHTTVAGKNVQLLTGLHVTEASPVLRGANPATRTLAVSGDVADVAAREYGRYVEAGLIRQLAGELATIREGIGAV